VRLSFLNHTNKNAKMIERDYIMRMIAQLAAVLARILGAKNAQDYTQALQLVQDAYGEIFGLQRELVEQMDAATLALLLGEGEKIKGLASLLREEGDVLLLQGQPTKGYEKYEKALALYQEALRLQTTEDADCLAAIATLQAKLAEWA
jgi:tetratricopeptide (TPR) repeat protein